MILITSVGFNLLQLDPKVKKEQLINNLFKKFTFFFLLCFEYLYSSMVISEGASIRIIFYFFKIKKSSSILNYSHQFSKVIYAQNVKSGNNKLSMSWRYDSNKELNKDVKKKQFNKRVALNLSSKIIVEIIKEKNVLTKKKTSPIYDLLFVFLIFG